MSKKHDKLMKDLQPFLYEAMTRSAAYGHSVLMTALDEQRGGYYRWEGECAKCGAICTAVPVDVFGLPNVMGQAVERRCKHERVNPKT